MGDVIIKAPPAAGGAGGPKPDGADAKVAPAAASAQTEASGSGGVLHVLLAAKAAYEKSTLYRKWKRDNPLEYARIESYWERGDVFPMTINAFGLAYALVADSYHEQTAVMPFAPI